jgi:hypothetical protein
MNKFTFKTIRAGFVLSFGLFTAVSTVFASATILSVQTTDITDTTATLNSQYDNPGMNSYVHFEWGYGSSLLSNTAGTQSFSTGNSFKTTLEGLTPNTTYSYRAVVIARPATGGAAQAPVYSQLVSFTTAPTKSTVANTSSTQTNTGSTNNAPQSGSSKNTNSNNTTTTKTTSVATVKKAEVAPVVVDTKEGFTNNNGAGASVIGSGVSIFPTTLTGWVILLIALFILLLVGRMIYEQSEKRKKALAAKKAAEAALAEVKKNQTPTV